MAAKRKTAKLPKPVRASLRQLTRDEMATIIAVICGAHGYANRLIYIDRRLYAWSVVADRCVRALKRALGEVHIVPVAKKRGRSK